MKYRATRPLAFLFVLTSLAASAAMAADVYKWTDKDGKVHYSERKPPDAREKAVDIRVANPPPQAGRPGATNEGGAGATSGASTPVKKREELGQATSSSPPKSLSGGKIDETKESKCNLARDVLSGAVRHGNGAPTDAHDRQVAENDIRIFCR